MRFLKVFFPFLILLLLAGCAAAGEPADIAASTGTVAQFAQIIAEGTDVTVAPVISDSVSCLHDYSLSVRQMEVLTQSRTVLLSGAGLEVFMEDALASVETVIDCSEGVTLLELEGHAHEESPQEDEPSGHDQEYDPHIWLDPDNAAIMAENICTALTALYPEHAQTFRTNTDGLIARLAELKAYGKETLSGLTNRELITFHDGFAYFANAYDLEIAAAIEEESGSEASAADLIEIIGVIQAHDVPAVFTETNGSVSAASIIEAEIGVPHYTLDMAMGGDYFTAMTHNIDTLKEALQ